MADNPPSNSGSAIQPEEQEKMLREAITQRATDIHIDPNHNGYEIRFRIDSLLTTWKHLSKESGTGLINQIKAYTGIETGATFYPVSQRQHLTVSGRPVEMRVTLVPCISGPKIAIRILDRETTRKTIHELGLPSCSLSGLQEWITSLNGMFLVTGPTASGKTTTLYAILNEIIEESRHVVTIEDPVEYEIDGVNQIQVDERHNLEFADGIKAALRLDPDCLMIGEIREPGAAIQTMNASIQGHVVMATMHSRDAVSAVTRLRNFNGENHQIAASLGLVANQRLVRKLCRECRQEKKLAAHEEKYFNRFQLDPPDTAFGPKGCESCRMTGYFDRTGLFEIWRLDETAYELISGNADEETIREKSKLSGRSSIHEHARDLIEEGVTSIDEVIRLGLDLPWSEYHMLK
ncbi:MAG: GspE/PulE family protein [Verrucomicrobiales bacterium]|nr:GspE/PulE family protein [bacterium]MDF2377993.1 GspE/PulE family protein [Verrucomicrobiales bacterium]